MKTDSSTIIKKLSEEHKYYTDSLQLRIQKLSNDVEVLSKSLDNQLEVINKAHEFYNTAWIVLSTLIFVFAGALPVYLQYLNKKRDDEMRNALENDINNKEQASLKRTKKVKKKIKDDFLQLESSLTEKFNTQEEVISSLQMDINTSVTDLNNDYKAIIKELKENQIEQKNKTEAYLYRLQAHISYNEKNYYQAIVNCIKSVKYFSKINASDNSVKSILKNVRKSIHHGSSQDFNDAEKALIRQRYIISIATLLDEIDNQYQNNQSILKEVTNVKNVIKEKNILQ